MTITFGSLFAGIGGFDLGMERAGLQAIWQCENNKDCQRVLKRHWPNTRLYNDVKEINAANTTSPDVLVGGFPCQDLSVAGKRAGLAGERSGLWFEFHRIFAELKPRFIVIENVPGLLSSSNGRDFAVILRGLAECGYYAAWRVLDAQYFGVAQRRRRVFIVASLGNGSCAQVLFESEGGAWDSPPGRETGQRVAGTIAAGAHPGSYNGRDAERDMLIPFDTTQITSSQNRNNPQPGDPCHPLSSAAHPPAVAFSESGPGWWRDGVGTLRERDYKDGNTGLICNAFNGYTGGADDNDAQGWHIVPALTSNGDAHSGLRDEKGLIAFDYCIGGSERTQIHRGNGYAQLQTRPDAIAGSSIGVRRLTPVECERLQGFPDGFTDGQSDSARYRQLGNAVAVPCAKWIGERLLEVLSLTK